MRFSTWWCFYRDTTGRQTTLDIFVEQQEVILTTANEILRFSPLELGMLLENLESVAEHFIRTPPPPG